MSTTHETVAEAFADVGSAAEPRITLAARELTRRYGQGEAAVNALEAVTFDMPAGQFAAVMGPSGSGKSTLMHLLAGLDEPTSGTAHVGGTQITGMSDRELTRLRRKHIGFVFQAFNLLPMLTAEENIALPLRIAGRAIDREWLEAVIHTVGLHERRRHRPAELSGGQQQRVAVARALVTEPTILFADEPTGNLDSASGQQILGLLTQASEVHGQTTLMVTHDPRAAAAADRVLFLADGRLIADRVRPTEGEILELMKEVSR